jgi:hypothetical protein
MSDTSFDEETMIRPLLLLLSPALLAACTSEPMDTIDPALGYSVRHNMAAHIIELPTPLSETGPGIPGPRSGLAIDRYMKGEMIKPDTENVNTLNIMGGQ